MTPEIVIIWSCVAVFIITAILTLLHVSGIRPLPNADHGKVLFRALIIEIVVVAVGVFSSIVLPDKPEPDKGTLPGSMGVFPNQEENDTWPTMTIPPVADQPPVTQPNQPLNQNCYQITVSDGSTFPPTSRIETICN